MALLPVDGDRGIAERDRLVDRLLAGDHAHELGLGLDLAAGMAVAQLVGDERLELGLVGGLHGLGEIIDSLLDRPLIGELRRGQPKAGNRPRTQARWRQPGDDK